MVNSTITVSPPKGSSQEQADAPYGATPTASGVYPSKPSRTRIILACSLGVGLGLIVEAFVLLLLTVLAWSDGMDHAAADRQALFALIASPLLGVLVAGVTVWQITHDRRAAKIACLILLPLAIAPLAVFLPGYFGLN